MISLFKLFTHSIIKTFLSPFGLVILSCDLNYALQFDFKTMGIFVSKGFGEKIHAWDDGEYGFRPCHLHCLKWNLNGDGIFN